MSEHSESNQMDDANNESTPRRKKSWKGLLVVLALIGGLATIYLLNPNTRSYALIAISEVMNSTSKWANPEPVHDKELMFHAYTNIRQENWPEAKKAFEQLVLQEPENYTFWNFLATAYHNLQDYEAAIEANLKVVEAPGYATRAWYNLACEYALTDRKDEAFDSLHQAVRYGYRNFDYMNGDADLESLRDDERYRFPLGPEFHEFTCADGTVIEYALVLPRNFDETKSYPALLGLGGGNQARGSINYGLNNFWGMQAVYHEWIVIAPAAPDGDTYYYGDAYRYIPELLDLVEDRFRIEGGKFHIAGLSNGGTSAFRIATNFPERFFSITGFPGYAIPGDDFERLENLEGMTISMFYGEKDLGPARRQSIRSLRQLKKLGIPSTLKEFPGEPHIPWSLLGDAMMTYLDSVRERIPAISASPGS